MHYREQFNYHVWMSLSRIIEKRYHRFIGFSPAIDSLDLTKDFILSRHGDLYIPILNKNEFFGCIHIRQGASLEIKDINSIHSMVQEVVHVLLDLNAPYSTVEKFESLYENKKHLINLVGGSYEETQKISCHIQDILNSWSLLPWSDAGMANWNSEEMKSLSDISIYIRDILELSPLERQQLIVLGKLPISMRPHLILCSSKPLEEHLKENEVEEELLEIFSNSVLYTEQLIQNPLHTKEVLEMLLHASTVSPINGEKSRL